MVYPAVSGLARRRVFAKDGNMITGVPVRFCFDFRPSEVCYIAVSKSYEAGEEKGVLYHRVGTGCFYPAT
ncbi:hypothetical protein Barb4_02442 [Bacteroidales bacterium Barb4]|nr:hypothetical protein Barb4_02442 [Bacteroidales bacterium Barb4]